MNREDMVYEPKITGSVRILETIDIAPLNKSLEFYIKNAIENNVLQQNLRLAENFHEVGDLSNHSNKNILEKDFKFWAPNTTYLSNISKKLQVHDFGRVRMLMMQPKTSYSFHKDQDQWRIHIPLITNIDSFLIVDGKLWHLPVGYAYLVKVEDYHLALNAGNEKRIHIVFDFCKHLAN